MLKNDAKAVIRNLELYRKTLPRPLPPEGSILGIDLSLTSTGIAALSFPGRELVLLESFKTKANGHYWLRIHSIYEKMASVLKTRPLLVCYEDYAFASPYNRERMGELGAQLKRALFETGVPAMAVAPVQLKKFVAGQSHMPKDMIVKEVLKRFGVDAATDDEADAYALARIAYEAVAMATTRYDAIRNGIKSDKKFVKDGSWKKMPAFRSQVLLRVAALRLDEVSEYMPADGDARG